MKGKFYFSQSDQEPVKTKPDVTKTQPKKINTCVSNQFCREKPISRHKQFFGFCYQCKTAFCRQCFHQKNKEHPNHTLESSKPLRFRIQRFRQFLKRQQFNAVTEQNFVFTRDKNENEILQKFTNPEYIKWLSQVKFWEYFNNKQSQAKIKKLKKHFLSEYVSENRNSVSEENIQTIIDWGKINGTNGDSIFDQMFKQAANQKQRLMREKDIVEILIHVYSSFNENTKKQSIQKIQKAYQNYPNESILLMAHLYLLELNKKNQNIWMPILKKIIQLSPELKDSPLEAFIQSHKYWEVIGKQQAKKDKKSIKFVDASSGNVYRLSNPQKYTQILNKALIKNGKCYILLAAKGLGLLAQQKYVEATKCFVQASDAVSYESYKMNKLYSIFKDGSQNNIPAQSILEQLENKSKHYIINAIKYLKTNNDYQKIIQCCMALKQQKNQSTFTQIELMKALIKLGQVQQASQVRKQISKDKINDELSYRLNRQLIYAQARNQVKQNNNVAAAEKCQQLVNGKQSASALYSLASVYYNQQMWQQAEINIDKALKLKSGSKKYKKLKFYILLMKKQLEQAKQLMKDLQSQDVDPKIKEMLIQLS